MTFTEAAAEVLRTVGKPLHYKEITELAIEKNLLSHVGKSPEVTMGARLAALLKKEEEENPFVRVRPGVFGLRDWGAAKKPEVATANPDADDDEGTSVNALEVEGAIAGEAEAAAAVEEDDKPILSPEDAFRANLAASGADLFDDEDDDDQPILGGPPPSVEPASGGAAAAGDAAGDGGRRRRRRRRRGRGGNEGDERGSGPRLEPIPAGALGASEDNGVVVERDPLAPPPRPMVRERHQIMAGGAPTGIDVPLTDGDELAGAELADAALMVLSGFDRSQGPVGVRAVVDQLTRRGRLPNDAQSGASQLLASLRADNLRRASSGQRPRFRFGQGPRVAPTDWALSPELVRLEAEAMQAVERYREAARRTLLRKLQELPGHALVELVLLALERSTLGSVRSIRRAGAPGGEAHFAAVHRSAADEARVAVVIRKDGREIGRERVTDLRGALHHYGPATMGLLVTTGQVLSGAREEASANPQVPVSLFDGAGLCRLLEEADVAVTRTRLTTAIPDLELLEQLRS